MGMKLPSEVSKITLFAGPSEGAYPPMGFCAFEECALGNGDYFGLYWPIGSEQQEPIIIEMRHDEGALIPAFSSLAAFLRMAQIKGFNGWVDIPSLEEDPQSPAALYRAARHAISAAIPDTAISQLEDAA